MQKRMFFSFIVLVAMVMCYLTQFATSETHAVKSGLDNLEVLADPEIYASAPCYVKQGKNCTYTSLVFNPSTGDYVKVSTVIPDAISWEP